MKERNSQVALITGSGRGIGRSAALELARQGLKVALVARNQVEIEAVSAEIKTLGGTALAVPFDLGNLDQIEELAGQVKAGLGPVDILVNNAAVVGPFGPAWEIDPEEWARVVEINLISPNRLIRAVLPGMRERNRGRIINVSSSAALSPMERTGAYSTSKAGLDMMTHQLGVELGDSSGIAVISFYPGTVDTSMQATIRQQPAEKVGQALAGRFQGYYTSGKCLSPDIAGRVIAALAGEAGLEFRGQVINITDPLVQALLASPSLE